MGKTIVIVHEKGDYDYKIRYEFDTRDEARNFMKHMIGVLVVIDFYTEAKKH